MQQWYQCPRCHYPNPLSQQFCGACGEKLIADCPYCGSPGTGGFFCATCGRRLSGATPADEWPPMCVLALDPQNKVPVGFIVESSRLVVIPGIAEDGRLALLGTGDKHQFRELQKHISEDINRRYSDCKTHTLVGVSVAALDRSEVKPHAWAIICELSGSLQTIPEIHILYDSLAKLRVPNDEYWNQVENFFTSEPRRSFINTLITHLKKELNWREYVERNLVALGLAHLDRVTGEVWTVEKLKRV
jgi:hypothetical protein